ncbi:MAG: tRNA (N(6)-L-threonylcarbamoyladenosine(37)-C(2))-methylthiotransferase [Candidatus Hermodarchaeota archaeon]
MLENSFYIETYGCTSNKADSYIISNILLNSGYVQANLEDAQFLIINTCAVKEPTENKIKERLKTLHETYRRTNKYIIVAGCLPHITPEYIDVIKKIIPSFAAIIDLDVFRDLPVIFKRIKEGEKNLIFKTVQLIDKAEILIKHPVEKITGIVPISEGCLGSCTYCCVKFARGKLNCYNPNNIVDNTKFQLEQGIKQIYLTSQDCSVYKHNTTNLLELIKTINNLDFKFYLRLGMINPSFLIDNIDQIISIFNFPNVYQFLHTPIQSGSNRILEKMQRKYQISEIIDNLEILRKKFPYLTISTDIICGFPNESEYEFYRTINFIKWLKPEILNISKFTARPGTKAKEMAQLDSKTIKERSVRLSKVYKNSLIHINDKWKGWKGEVLTLHEGLKPQQVLSRNFAYKNIFINDYNAELGRFVKVKIEKVEGFNLYAKTI